MLIAKDKLCPKSSRFCSLFVLHIYGKWSYIIIAHLWREEMWKKYERNSVSMDRVHNLWNDYQLQLQIISKCRPRLILQLIFWKYWKRLESWINFMKLKAHSPKSAARIYAVFLRSSRVKGFLLCLPQAWALRITRNHATHHFCNIFTEDFSSFYN